VSGDDITLLDDGSGSIARLVRAAASLFSGEHGRAAALIGGLAVTVRIATVHRVTNDVDAVIDDATDGSLAAITDDHAARIAIDGVKVDMMATSPLPALGADLPEDDHHRLFVLAHRWALESATPISVAVHGVADVRANLIVATAPALLACKLHAIADRRDTRADKRESDARDIQRLAQLMVRDPQLGDRYAAAPFDLATLVAGGVQRWLVDDVTRTARLIAIGTGVGEASVGPEDLATLGRLLLSTLSHL
jgi:hypothetical protein